MAAYENDVAVWKALTYNSSMMIHICCAYIYFCIAYYKTIVCLTFCSKQFKLVNETYLPIDSFNILGLII